MKHLAWLLPMTVTAVACYFGSLADRGIHLSPIATDFRYLMYILFLGAVVAVVSQNSRRSIGETRMVDSLRWTIAVIVANTLWILLELTSYHPTIGFVRMIVAVNLLLSLSVLNSRTAR